MTTRRADVVVIGGGVNGASIAMHLARMGAGRVLLLEKGHLAAGASGRSGAMVRQHYLHPVLVRMAVEASAVFHNFADAVGGDPRFQQTGRLLLFSEHDAAAARANVAMNIAEGANIRLVSLEEAAGLAPELNLDGVAVAAYEPEAGHADPIATTYAFADRARDYGADIVTGCPVTAIATAGGRVTGVETPAGLVECDAVVAVTGPWVNQLAAPLGETLEVKPIRVQMVILRRPPSLEGLSTIVMDHISGTYLRVNAGSTTLAGAMFEEDLSEDADPDAYGLNADHDAIVTYWDRASRRAPGFAAATPLGGYGSLYDLTPDGNPILDASAAVRGLYWAAGFSGHGFKLSPVVGRMVAELVLHGESTGHPIRPFRASRFAEGDPLGADHPYTGTAHQ